MREGKIRKIHQNTSAMLLTKTLGWGEEGRNGIKRNIKAVTNEYRCLRRRVVVKDYSVSGLDDRMK